ncbi:MAG: polysaccharide biosynthesis protein [Lachnospiraceae bacterium]|nr:polysaccharide biosynthesis protein [Lachnospiraceae bacterium]
MIGKNKIETAKKRRLEHWQYVTVFLVIYDIVAVNLSYFLALWVRFDAKLSNIPEYYMGAFLKFVPIYTVFCIAVFGILKLYRSIWRFASYRELSRITIASFITSLFHTCLITYLYRRMPISYYTFGMVIQFLLVVGIRFSYRFLLLQQGIMSNVLDKDKVEKTGRVMLIGAGSAGQMILRDVNHGKETEDRVYCIIDDDPNKWNRYIDDVPVVGGRDDIFANVERYKINKIYVALPNSTVQEKRDILNICKESGCELKNLPGMYQLVNGDVTVNSMRNVAIEDLLGREPIKVNMDEICSYIKDKVILVTGGGGSIGSELCRQIAERGPRKLVVFDIYENNAYDIEQELRTDYPGLDLDVVIGSVRDSRRINQVFELYHPEIVYHAAAHKHVPLMEDSPCEAIKNNAIGTYKTAYAAMVYGCKRFVLISTDKAVNPTNVMGASKRLCEMVIQSFDQKIKEGKSYEIPQLYEHSNEDIKILKSLVDAGFKDKDSEDNNVVKLDIKSNSSLKDLDIEDENLRQTYENIMKRAGGGGTEFVAVRFGNVLGSNGSVVPKFKKQIANGGPVTVTHPDIIRYFMTIPEAVSLVLQAGVYARGGEIFVLEMGTPVKIDTLARNLIKLSGFKPDVDIKIEYTGLRPGEKLYEEKLMAEEGMKTTPNKLIYIGKPIDFDHDRFLRDINILMRMCYDNRDDIREYLKKVVPTFHPLDNCQED